MNKAFLRIKISELQQIRVHLSDGTISEMDPAHGSIFVGLENQQAVEHFNKLAEAISFFSSPVNANGIEFDIAGR